MPKAGTHLLTRVLEELPGLNYSGRHIYFESHVRGRDALGLPLPTAEEVTRLASRVVKTASGQYLTAHLPFDPGLSGQLVAGGVRVLHIMRDPRDIAVSRVHYVLSLPRHPLHDRLARIGTFDEVLLASIDGLPPVGDSPGLPPLGVAVARFIPWTEADGVLAIKFEDLVGARGGGSDQAQRETVLAISGFVECPVAEGAAAAIGGRIFGGDQSATFRSGKAGGWREVLRPEHVIAMKRQVGSALVAMGYENDEAWSA